MEKIIAIYPGTFDPITKGHVDIAVRSSFLFDKVVVAVGDNKKKEATISKEERVNFAKQALGSYEKIEVMFFSGLLVNFADKINARVIIRGLRAISDFEYEFQMADVNRKLMNSIETIFFTPSEQYSYISSSMVREIAGLGGDISSFVPKEILNCVIDKFSQNKS